MESGQTRELHPPLQYIAAPRWLRDGRSLITAGRDFKGRGRISLIDAETGRETILVADTDATNRVQVTPDGKKIYYSISSPTQSIVAHDLVSGEIRTVVSGPGGAVELSPDGLWLARVAFSADRKTDTLTVFPTGGGQPRELLHIQRPDAIQGFNAMLWTPGSDAIIVVIQTGPTLAPKELWMVPLDGSKPRKLDIDITAWKTGAGVRLRPDGKQIAFFTGRDIREVWALENVLPATPASR